MKIQQFVMAYSVEHDRLRAILPEGFLSIRPVLRFNGEIREEQTGYLEFNTAVEKDGIRGWLNIGFWENIPFVREGKKATFQNNSLEISFEGIGIAGGCPAEKDNAGCFFLGDPVFLRPAETVTSRKEFCDCKFRWKLPDGAFGESIGKTLPACPEEIKTLYPREEFAVANAASIPCKQVLGTYMVEFNRGEE